MSERPREGESHVSIEVATNDGIVRVRRYKCLEIRPEFFVYLLVVVVEGAVGRDHCVRVGDERCTSFHQRQLWVKGRPIQESDVFVTRECHTIKLHVRGGHVCALQTYNVELLHYRSQMCHIASKGTAVEGAASHLLLCFEMREMIKSVVCCCGIVFRVSCESPLTGT